MNFKLPIYGILTVCILLFSCENEPYEGEIPKNDVLENNCEELILLTNIAANNFSNFNSLENYSELCKTYKEALEIQILNCGDTTGDLQNILNDLGDCEPTEFSLDCDEITIPKVYSGSINCDYELLKTLQVANVYIEDKETFHDVNLDGTIDHYSKLIYVTDGVVVTDEFNQFKSFDKSSYVMNFVIMSNQVDDLVNGIYLMISTLGVNTTTDSYLVGGHFGSETINFNSFKNGVIGLNKNGSFYSLCFDILIDENGNCFKGSFDGVFIEVAF